MIVLRMGMLNHYKNVFQKYLYISSRVWLLLQTFMYNSIFELLQATLFVNLCEICHFNSVSLETCTAARLLLYFLVLLQKHSSVS